MTFIKLGIFVLKTFSFRPNLKQWMKDTQEPVQSMKHGVKGVGI